MNLWTSPLDETFDFTVLRFDPTGGTIAAGATTGDVQSGDGALLPTIETDKWIAAVSVETDDPETVTRAELQNGDWLHITGESSDTLTFVRTASARTIQAGEYIFLAFSSFSTSALNKKIEALEAMLHAVGKGGHDGVVRYGTTGTPDELAVEPTSPATMAVLVKAGLAFVNGQVFRLLEEATTGLITAPVSQDRIDLVQAVPGVQSAIDAVSVKTGVEAGSPSVPTVDSGALALGSIYLETTTTTITASEITDQRLRI